MNSDLPDLNSEYLLGACLTLGLCTGVGSTGSKWGQTAYICAFAGVLNIEVGVSPFSVLGEGRGNLTLWRLLKLTD